MYGKVKRSLIALLVLGSSLSSQAQDDEKVYQDAMRYMERGKYDEALEAFRYIRHLPEVKYQVEACSLLSKRYRNSPLSRYIKYQNEQAENPKYYYWLGKIYLRRMNQSEAQEAFGEYLQLATGRAGFNQQVQEVRGIYNHLQKWSKSVNILPLQSPVNTIHCEALGDVIGDGMQLVFASDRAEEGQYRLYQANMTGEGWSAPKEWLATNVTLQHANLVEVRNQAVVYLDPEEQQLKALIEAGENSTPVDGPDLTDARHLYINAHRTRVIFSAPDATGNLNLYESFKLRSTGEWMVPVSISNQINTGYNEDFPYLSDDRSRLYFSSDREGGVGKYDIYVSVFDVDNNAWGDPINLGMPINTPDNEFSYRPVKEGQALISSDRIESLGEMDLFVVEY
ncbi:PD40 domain-containing protein [Marinoscillum furvescens]|uniref:WD40 repeat protein n=1 Tax=Marinoscillum furvescens DSM 4134 TaxID=1122208 RepID=A0A3D9L6Q2_MARFU|nr:PD40 domain-containing protein [Marinoscillum furvescens]REE00411.1 WD40 repeat protein [Marinoscillum furvescens DSM 4134]